jgi:tetratricopeptide (TPR) repeat protein
MKIVTSIACLTCLISLCGTASAAEAEHQKFHRLGVEANKQGNLDQAIRYYSQAIALKPKTAPLYFVRGRAYKQQGNLDKAITDLTRAIELKADYAEAYNNRGVAYIGKKLEKNAQADFKKACGLGSQEGCANARKLTAPRK